MQIKSPKETGKTFESNSRLKANFFSKFVDFPVISDDSGLCIKSLKNTPGVYSARLAKEKGGFNNAMKYILKKLKLKKNRSAFFVCNLTYKSQDGKLINVQGKIGTFSFKDKKVVQELEIYKTENNKFIKY